MIIFKYKGIPVRIHFSFWILVAFLLVPEAVLGNFNNVAFLSFSIVGLFGSVVLHEFGHALMARKFYIDTRSITLYPFGGIAALAGEPPTSKSELYIALAGPAVNLILCVLFLPLALIGLPGAPELVVINVALGVFNLIPAFPMDGGRVLRAYLSTRMSKQLATIKSLQVSQVFAWIFVIVGFVMSNLSLLIVGGFLFFVIGKIKQQV